MALGCKHCRMACQQTRCTYGDLAVIDELPQIQLLHLACHRVLDLRPQLPNLELQSTGAKMTVMGSTYYCRQQWRDRAASSLLCAICAAISPASQ